MSQETQTGLCINLEGWDWEGGSEGRGYMCPWTDSRSGLTENNKIL